MSALQNDDTIVALATPPGVGAISVVRLSGKDAFVLANKIFQGKDLAKQESHTIHHGKIYDGEKRVDEVLVSVFVAPHSYTRENVVEISSHGSPYVQEKIIQLCIKNGARLAKAGEFTLRAFLNGAMDLSSAEAVADLIASQSEMSHRTAVTQLRGGVFNEIKKLREQLTRFASLIELELDFSEEDVSFADRKTLTQLIENILDEIKKLKQSFDFGNAIKNGISAVIAGKPNVGKSTLLNALLNEEKAIVSPIPGTTRDVIEDVINIGGYTFRLMDTAGLRKAKDEIESIGVERARKNMERARLLLYVYDCTAVDKINLEKELDEIRKINSLLRIIPVANKMDLLSNGKSRNGNSVGSIYISALHQKGIERLKEKMLNEVSSRAKDFQSDVIITNRRHHRALEETEKHLEKVVENLRKEISKELLASDIRSALQTLGEITGEITNEDILNEIFSKFCIGK